MARLFGQCAFALSVLSRMYSARGGDTLRVGPATCEYARTGRSTRRRMHTPQAEPTGNARLARGLPRLILQRMIGLHNCMCAIRHLR